METSYIVTLLVGAIASVSTAMGLVWRAGEQKAQRIEEVYDRLVKSKDEEIVRWQQIVSDLRQDSSLSRAADAKLAETFATLREAVLAALPATARGRAR